MKKSKKNSKAKVFYLGTKESETRTSSPSEVTRSLFSETWRNYLDEVTMVSIKMKEKSLKEVKSMKREVELKKSKNTSKLSLIK